MAKKKEEEVSIVEATEARIARAAYFRNKFSREITHKATELAKADRSDPFVFDRVMSHYYNGACTDINDYGVGFQNEPRVTATGKEFFIEVPVNQTRL